MHPTATLRNFVKNQGGAALIEFAIVLPLLLILIFLTLEFGRFLIINLKVQNAAYAMGSIISQFPPATKARAPGEISFDALNTGLGGDQLVKMLSPFGNDKSQEGMIATSIVRDTLIPGTPTEMHIKWQIFTAGSIGNVTSIVNGKTPAEIVDYPAFVQNLPPSFDATRNPGVSASNLSTMLDGENLIVVEVFYHYEPLYTQFFNAIGTNYPSFNFPGITARTITRQTFLQPRLGTLECLPGAPGDKFIYPSCIP